MQYTISMIKTYLSYALKIRAVGDITMREHMAYLT